jgi:gliding motility-associated-like protein
MSNIFKYLALLAFLTFSVTISAQTIIWQENFAGAPPAPGWDDNNFLDCDGTPESFNGVRNGRYEVQDMEGNPCCAAGGGGDNTWVTNEIDIDGYCNVGISIEYGSIGTFECSAGGPHLGCTGDVAIDNGHDQIIFEYSINGGGWTQFGYICGGGNGTATVGMLSGNTIRVRVTLSNKSTAETYWFDNVTVSGTLPTVDPEADISGCAGTAISVSFSGTGTPPPTFNWTNDNTNIGLGASGSGNINFTPPSNLGQQEVATITVTPQSGTCFGDPITFTITVNPLPLTNDPPDIVACSGDFVEVIFSGSDPNAVYNWTVNNVPLFPPSGQGDISGTVPPLPFSLSGSITVSAEANGCDGPPQTFNVTLHPAVSATFSLNGPSSICAGQSAAFSVNFSGGGAPYTFIYAIDNVQQPPLMTNNDPFNFTVPLTANATVSAVSMQAGNGCVQDVDGSFDIVVNPLPTATIGAGPTNLCAGQTLDIPITFNGSDDYTFVYTINNVPQPAITATGPDYTLTVTPPVGTTNYTLTTVSSNGCTGTASGTHQAIVTPLPTAIINGNPVVCAGQNVNIPVTLSGSAPWTIVYSIDGVDQPPVTTNNSPYLISGSYTTSTTLELTSVSTNNCDGSVSGLAFITVLPGVAGVLASGTNAICIGQTDTLDFTFSGTAPYNFVYSINGTPQPTISTSNTTYQIAVSPAVPTTYTLTSISNGSCPGGSVSGTYTLNVASPPTAIIMGTDTICAESSAPLTVTFTGTAPWTFAYSANGIPVDTITTSSNPYIITVKPTNTTTYSLTSVSSGSCGGSISGSATIRINPNPTVTLTGGGQICQNGSGTNLVFNFTGTAPWTVTYRANNDTLTATSSVSPLVIPVNPNIGTIYRLIEISDSLCTDTAVGQVIVFVFTPANAQFLGSATFCDSANTQVSIDFTGTGPFTINYTINGIAQQPDTTFDDPYFIPVNVTSTTIFQLTSIESPGCLGIISGPPAIITVNYAPTYANLNLICNPVNGTYRVTFDVLGATLPLTLTGGNSGSFSGTTFTSNPIPQSQGYSFTFHDVNLCGDVTVSGQSTCNCTTEVGTMNLSAIDACQDEQVTAIYNGGFVDDGNDTLLYIIHENPALPIGTIYGWSATPTFGIQPGMNPGTTYYISALAGNTTAGGLVDTSDLCTVIAQGTPVVFYAFPTATITPGNITACAGDVVDLTVSFTGTGPFGLNYAINNVPQPPVSNISGNTYMLQVPVNSNSVVTIISISDSHCSNTGSSALATITVTPTPQAGNIQTVCDYSTGTYSVTFDIIAGTPPFSVAGIAGFFNGTNFTSIPIPFASSDFFATLSDGGNCGQDTIAGIANCNCTSDAGTMSQTQVNACQNATLNVNAAQGTVLDNDDQLMYIMHTNPGIPLGIIVGWSNTPSFTFGPPMQTGVTYYVSSIVGNPDGNGMIDLLDPCLSVATGTPVQWRPTPSATMASNSYNICPGSTQQLIVSLMGSQPFSLNYTINGNPFTIAPITQMNFLIGATLQQSATFTLVSISDATGCTGTVSGSAVVTVHPPPAASNFSSTCDPLTQTYVLEFDVTQGDLSTMSVNNLPGIYDPVTGHFISSPIPSGQPYTVQLQDSWNCGTFTQTDSVSCACTTDAGVMDPTPITVCYGATVTAPAAMGINLEPGDALLYFLVGQSSQPPNWTILEINTSPTFAYNPTLLTPGTPYFIVAVAGNSNGANSIDLSDPCISIVPGPQVIWRPEVTASLSGNPVVCPGNPATIQVQFAGDGPFNLGYTDGTNPAVNLSNISQNPYAILLNPTAGGNYILTSVTGAGGCTGTLAGNALVTISNPPQVLNLVEDCDLNTETYTLTFDIGNGAQANPIYTIIGVTGSLNDTTFTSNPIPGGQPYTIVVGNPTGCTTSINGTVACACATSAGTLTNPQNACLPNGLVSAQASGNQTLDPNDALIYLLCTNPAILPAGILAQSNSPQFSFQNGMSAGTTYFIVAIAGNMLAGGVDPQDPCLSVSQGVPVVFNAAPAASISGSSNICSGDNASFQVLLTGAAPFSFVYAINGVPQPQVNTNNTTFSILSNNIQQDQTFTLVLANDANCPGTVSGQAEAIVSPAPQGAITGDLSICAGDTAALTLVLSGGTTYNVTINGPNPPLQLNGVQNGHVFNVSPLGTTTYTISNLTATGNTCAAQIGAGATITTSSLAANSTLSDYNGFNTSCPLTTDGTISLTTVGGVTPIQVNWSNGASALNVSNLSAGTYTVTLTDNIGCTFSNSYTLIAPPELSILFDTESPICFGDNNGRLIINGITGGAGPFALSLNGNAQQTATTFPVIFSGLGSGPQLLEVEDANGCISDAQASVPAPQELVVNLGSDTTLRLGDSILVQALLNFTNVESFEWQPTQYLSNPDTLASMSFPLTSIRYTLVVVDSNGCEVSEDLLITVNREKPVYIPNIIHPNADGSNNIFTVYAGQEVRQIRTMQIFDRWGELLFENRNFLPNDEFYGWEGRAKGQDVSPGVYIYLIEVEYVDGETEVFSGDVTVIR